MEKNVGGRPRLPVTIRYEKALLEKGMVRAKFGGKSGTTPQQARVRLHNTANRLGIKIETRKTGNYIEARRLT